jgi:hypothetical protein
MPKKIDPLNKKNYTAITAALCVTDVKAAANFCQKAFGLGWQRRRWHNGTFLTLRGFSHKILLSPGYVSACNAVGLLLK